MKAKVTTLYRKGKYLPSPKVGATAEGDLNLMTGKHPVLGRVTVEACVVDERGVSQVPDMHDAVCACIAANGFRLRGTECINGIEYAQEWWCVPIV